MFHRLVLRTTPKPFVTTTTYNAPRCLLPLFSYPKATVCRGHVRSKHLYRKRASATTSGGSGRGNRLHLEWDFEISPPAFSSLKALGMSRDEAFNLLGAIRVRTSEARGLRFIFDCLNNRETFIQNETKIPKAYLKPWTNSIILDKAAGYDIADIGPHSNPVIGAACHVLGLDLLRKAEENYDVNYMSFGCFLLELAVLYERHDAAAHLINYYNDPVRANLLVQALLQTSTHEAEILIRDLATKAPQDTPDGAMLVYLRKEYSPRGIALQNPRQLQWGYTITKNVEVTSESILRNAMPCDIYPHPAQIRLQILEHCMSKNIPLPELSLDEMLEARNQCLNELAAFNDPRASLILALREDGPEIYSEEWGRLLLAAAAGGNREACHLLSLHHLHNEGILPPGPNSKEVMDASLGLEFGRICILAHIHIPESFVGFTSAYAAVCRMAGDYERGLNILEESFALAKNDPNFPRRELARLDDRDGHIFDYKLEDSWRIGYWSEEKMKKWLPVVDTEWHVDALRQTYY